MPNTHITGPEQKPEDESISFVLPGNESELRQMIAALPGMLWTANPQGMFDFISPQWRELTGQPLTRLLGMGWLNVVHADDREAVREQWKIVADNPAPLILEFRLCTGEGQSRWFSMRGTPIFDELKCMDRWFGLCVDIDDFKLTQKNLRVTERRYDVLFDNKTNGAVQLQMIYDAQGNAIDARVVRVNQTYTSILGLSNEHVEGCLLTELFPGIRGFDIDYIALYGKMAGNAGEANFETDFHAAEKWLRVYAYSAFPGEIIAIFSDISAQKKAEQSLRESEEHLRLIIDNLAEGLIVVGPDGQSLHWNRMALEMHGYSGDEAQLGSLQDISGDYQFITFDGHRLPFEEWPIPRLLRGEILRNLDLTLCNIYQYWERDLSYGGVLVKDHDGKPLMALLTIRDIAGRRNAERARTKAERRLQLAVDIAHLGSWELRLQDNTVYLSPQWKRLLGYAEHELPDATDEWESRLHPSDRKNALSGLQNFIDHPVGTFQSEYRMRHRDGDYRWMVTRAIAELNKDGKIESLVGTMLDVTHQKRIEQRVREAAQHDPLTGLPNRALIYEYASHLLAAANRKHSRGALLFIDLDRFKPVNDLHGHDIGDRLLKKVADRMLACVRREDLIGRIGGDEFVIVLPYLGKGFSAPTVARHVIDALSRPFHIHGLELSISASVGISFYPMHGHDVDILLHRADLAMYRAKETGRGNYQVYTSELHNRVDASASIEARLKRGLSENRFTLHYQPVIDVDNGQLVSVEALLRLPLDIGVESEVIGPDRFIPVAESAGMIAQLGDWVAAEVCRQIAAWRAEGLPPFRIAMNISPLQFRQRGFAARLLEIIRTHRVDPQYLQIDVTESCVMERVDDAIETLTELHAAGIQIALDDLGTGYSSLSTISHLPLDKLKIDQIFVKRLSYDPGSQAVAEAILAMGKTLKLEIIGEGIESEQTLEYLRQHGCHQIQGNLLSRPLPAEEF